jgi:hypothetical protein
MIKNLLLIAIRNFKKDKWFSLVNILGLTIGISFSLFLIFYITDELNYDRYNEKADRIYRIVSYIHEKDKNTDWTITQAPLAVIVESMQSAWRGCRQTPRRPRNLRRARPRQSMPPRICFYNIFRGVRFTDRGSVLRVDVTDSSGLARIGSLCTRRILFRRGS